MHDLLLHQPVIFHFHHRQAHFFRGFILETELQEDVGLLIDDGISHGFDSDDASMLPPQRGSMFSHEVNHLRAVFRRHLVGVGDFPDESIIFAIQQKGVIALRRPPDGTLLGGEAIVMTGMER